MSGWRQWLDQVLSRRAPLSERLILNRRTVYILPSKAGWLLISLLIIMLLTAINYQNSLVFGLCFWLLSVFSLLIWHTWRNLAGLELRVGAQTNGFVGEWSDVETLLISPRKQVHQHIQLLWRDGVSRVVDDGAEGDAEVEDICSIPSDVQPKEFCPISMPLEILHRGWNQSPRMEVFSRYPLGILTAWSVIRLPHKVLGYPKPLFDVVPKLTSACVDGDDSDQVSLQSSVPGSDFDSLSPYVEGDSLRKVDWKRFAKTEEMVVKSFVTPESANVWLKFDDFMALPLEHRLSALAGWVITWSKENRTFGLQLPDQVVEPDSGDHHRTHCLRALALFNALPERSSS